MNREEAITTLKNYIERITGGMFPGEREILVEAFDAMRGPHPDPITGLVPCGCGGRAKQEDFFDGFFYFGAIKCPGCEIEIRIPSLTPEESSDRVKVAWNRAMTA
jgi:hypothetical protein